MRRILRLLAALLLGQLTPRPVWVPRESGDYFAGLGREQWAREHPWEAYRY